MLSRAPRSTSHTPSTTPQSVGPGTYDSGAARRAITIKRASAAPFGSTSQRKTHALPKTDLGPGTYDTAGSLSPPPRDNNNNGTSSFKTTTRRFTRQSAEAPGPGAYVAPLPQTKKSFRVPPSEDSASGLTKRRYSRFTTPPSIPTTSQSYGYEDGAGGSLRPHQPPPSDSSLGPAYYGPQRVQTPPKGAVRFGIDRSRRVNFAGSAANPGPGKYTIAPTVAVDTKRQGEPAHQSSAFASKSGRYFEQHLRRASGVPGPGAYNQASPVGKKTFNVTFDS